MVLARFRNRIVLAIEQTVVLLKDPDGSIRSASVKLLSELVEHGETSLL